MSDEMFGCLRMRVSINFRYWNKEQEISHLSTGNKRRNLIQEEKKINTVWEETTKFFVQQISKIGNIY